MQPSTRKFQTLKPTFLTTRGARIGQAVLTALSKKDGSYQYDLRHCSATLRNPKGTLPPLPPPGSRAPLKPQGAKGLL